MRSTSCDERSDIISHNSFEDLLRTEIDNRFRKIDNKIAETVDVFGQPHEAHTMELTASPCTKVSSLVGWMKGDDHSRPEHTLVIHGSGMSQWIPVKRITLGDLTFESRPPTRKKELVNRVPANTDGHR